MSMVGLAKLSDNRRARARECRNRWSRENTISASAASVSRCAVGGSTPGSRRPVGGEDEHETACRAAAGRAGSTRMVSRIWSSIAPTMSSSTVWLCDGTTDRRRVTARAHQRQHRHEPPGDDDRLGDRHRAEVEECQALTAAIRSWLLSKAPQQRAAQPGTRAAPTSSGNAPQRASNAASDARRCGPIAARVAVPAGAGRQ